MNKLLLFVLVVALGFASCEKDPNTNNNNTSTGPKLVFKIKFDPNQQRLDAFGQPATLPNGHAAQNPAFNSMSLHNIELVPNALTPIQGGDVVYKGAETAAGGANAVNFAEAIVKGNNDIFYEVPLSEVTAGTYEYIRTSVTYQNYAVSYNITNIPVIGSLNNQQGTLASFVGFNTYLQNLTVDKLSKNINDDKLQGFWAFETSLSSPYESYNQIYTGDAPGTTVVNPLHSTTPIPAGSCLVTGDFVGNNLVITGNETEDIVIELSYCTNQSFEWQDTNGNGDWDIDASGSSLEAVVDMGLRGLQISVQ